MIKRIKKVDVIKITLKDTTVVDSIDLLLIIIGRFLRVIGRKSWFRKSNPSYEYTT